MATRPKTPTEPPARKPAASKQAIAIAKIEATGIDAICAQIEDGHMLMHIAAHLEVPRAVLCTWLTLDPIRAARAWESRVKSSAAYDELAASGIAEASDPFELSKAKELAHHYRWKASRLDPKRYGDKVEHAVTGADGGPVQNKLTIEYVRPKAVEGGE